jgi:hypothetical protein
MIHVHGFDWTFYTKTLMPAFARWLIGDDEQEVSRLYSGTPHALEEQFVPEAMQPLCAWPRACDFVHQLPRGPFAKREYQKLCVAEQFLLMSDRYVYRHPPRLYRESEALRTIWGATIQQYCLPWQQGGQEIREIYPEEQASNENELPTARGELFNLLQMAGLNELVEEVSEYISIREKEGRRLQEMSPVPGESLEEEERGSGGPRGIFIGQHPMTLHMRGWLGMQSIRAMVLFEYLVCGRRGMPFGYQESDPLGAYIGYLTPDEVEYLSQSLQGVHIPDRKEAEADYRAFRQQRSREHTTSRQVDEILPIYANDFFQATCNAAEQGLGLICTHSL